jgi:hypothetical protein
MEWLLFADVTMFDMHVEVIAGCVYYKLVLEYGEFGVGDRNEGRKDLHLHSATCYLYVPLFYLFLRYILYYSIQIVYVRCVR